MCQSDIIEIMSQPDNYLELGYWQIFTFRFHSVTYLYEG